MLHGLRAGLAGGGHGRRPRGKLTETARLAATGAFDDAHTPAEDPQLQAAWAALGLVASAGAAPERPAWHLWPCNTAVWGLWLALQTQWRVGMAGATGLDYAAVWAVLSNTPAIRHRQRAEVFQALQGMEFAVLQVWRERADQARPSGPLERK